RRRFPDRRLPDGGHPQAAPLEAVLDRPVRGVALHAVVLRPGLLLRAPDREQLRPGEALADGHRGCDPLVLAALPFVSRPAAVWHPRRSPRAAGRRSAIAAGRPALAGRAGTGTARAGGPGGTRRCARERPS